MPKHQGPWGGCAIMLLLALASVPTLAADGPAGLFVQGGTLPEQGGSGHASLVPLADGRALLYGVPRNIQTTLADKQARLRKRFERYGSTTSNNLYTAPRVWRPDDRRWETLERPPQCRANAELATATLLPDGQVLIAGGLCDQPRLGNDVSPIVPHTATSLWNSKTGKWETAAPSLAGTRIFHTASLLRDGSVLITGGEPDPALTVASGLTVLASTERYRNGQIELAADLATARARHTATTLADGSLLVAGGFDGNGQPLASAELWDPSDQRWKPVQAMGHARHGHTATLLDDGRVMVTGGIGPHGEAIGAVEYWDAGTRAWSVGKPMPTPSADHAAARLANGDVLVLRPAGTQSIGPAIAMLWRRERREWEPAGATVPMPQGALLLPRPDGSAHVVTSTHLLRWRPVSSAADAHKATHPADLSRRGAAFTPLPDGRVLISGGYRDNSFVDLAEVLEPEGNRFQLTGRMLQTRHSHRGIALPDGRVVVAGGWARSLQDPSQPQDSLAEVWSPGSGVWRTIPRVRFTWEEVVHFNLLADGRVFFLASRERSEGSPAKPPAYRAWLWNPGTDEATEVKVPLAPRAQAAVAVRPDGTVLVAGGTDRDGQADLRSELWNVASGAVDTQLPPMPIVAGGEPHTLLLRDGSVFIGFHEPANPVAGLLRNRSLHWSAATKTWTELLGLFSHEATRVVELPDGTLLSPTLRLAPGSTAWGDMRAVQGPDAVPVSLPTGRAVSVDFDAPHVAAFDQKAQGWDMLLPPDVAPTWIQKPAMTLLADGRVLLIGNVDAGPSAVNTAHIWHPQHGTWAPAGRLARRYGNTQAITLVSGDVIHLGQYQGAQHACERWSPKTQDWVFCQTMSARGTASPPGDGTAITVSTAPTEQPVLGRLGDGRAAVIWGRDNALVFNDADNTWQSMPLDWNREAVPLGAPVKPKQAFVARVTDPATPGQPIDASELGANYLQHQRYGPSALWNNTRREWTFAFAHKVGLGRDALVLPGGCAISLSTMRLFDPSTGLVTPLDTPAIEGDLRTASSLVLADGTVVAAMAAPHGLPGTQGLFHRQADCQGFVPADGEPPRPAPVPASSASAPASAAPPSWRERKDRALAMIEENRLVGMLSIVLVGLVGVAVRRRWLNWRHGIKPPASRGSQVFRWTVRLIVYGLALFIAYRMLGGYLVLRKIQQDDRCAFNAAACVDPGTGLIEGAAEVDDKPRIPCRYVGVWSSIRPQLVLRITLGDDGRYTAGQNLGRPDSGQRYEGRWAVQGPHMIWRHAQNDPGRPDTNRIVDETANSFTLIEEDGTRTRFERLEAIKSDRCVP